MRAGLLRYTIQFYASKEERGEYGSAKQTYELEKTCRAYVKFNSGTKTVENSEIMNIYNTTFKIRRTNVDYKWRVKYEDRYYNILSVNDDLKDQSTTIIAEVINE